MFRLISCAQTPGPYVKGQGYTYRSNVNIGYNSARPDRNSATVFIDLFQTVFALNATLVVS